MSAWTEIIDSVGADSRAGCCADRRKPCSYHEGLLDGLETAVVSAGVRPHLVIEHLGGQQVGSYGIGNASTACDPYLHPVWEECVSQCQPVFVFPKETT